MRGVVESIERQAVLDLFWSQGRITSSGVKDIPAADVAPVRHGRWVPEDVSPRTGEPVDWKCSKCGASAFEQTKYCPDCGARMDDKSIEPDSNQKGTSV